MLIDSHSHLDGEKYGSIDVLIDNFKAAGGGMLIDVGFDHPSSVAAKKNAESYGVYFAAGVHPQEADKDNDIGLIAPLLNGERCVAVGEIGLDHHYEPFSKNRQRELFESQIYLADKYKLPIIVHSRDASADMLDIIKSNKNRLTNGFLMHCYSESKEQAKNYLDLGGYFGFGGAITFKNAKKDDIIKFIPVDRLLAETDCPYMSPVPKRGEKNEPAFVTYVYDKLSDILAIERDDLENVLKDNFTRFFKKVRI